ncbi:D-alanyl-D-alanine carboxypeptidase family protein [Actinoplanes sp. NBC_00393]|uniref:D-alanyl-D-alanine carboxypeptidase family protein n=1 Tax=Actinoplanes sp. NBC_00393 TaxID=2975953 RepID=UPI002E239583
MAATDHLVSPFAVELGMEPETGVDSQFGDESGDEEAPAGSHPLAAVFALPRRAFDALAKGGWAAAVAVAAGAGVRDVNQLTNLVFWYRHPELIGQKLRADQRDLAQEWLRVRDEIVRPALAGLPPPASPPAPGPGRPGRTSIPAEGLRWFGPPQQQTPELMAFMRKVYALHVRRSRGDFVDTLPASALADVVPGKKARKDAAAKARDMLAAASNALAAAGLTGTVRIGVLSAYRSAARQFDIWQGKTTKGAGGFPHYYAATRAARNDPRFGGEHSDKAAAYLAQHMAGLVAAPGYSNHQDGLSLDLGTREGRGDLVKVYEGSWFHGWLRANAHLYDFEPLATEAWHWTYRPPAGTASEFEPAPEVWREDEAPPVVEPEEGLEEGGEQEAEDFEAVAENAFDGPEREGSEPLDLDPEASVLVWTRLLRFAPARVRRMMEDRLSEARERWLTANRPLRRRFPNEPATNLDGHPIPPWVSAPAVLDHLRRHYDQQHGALTAADQARRYSRAPGMVLGANPAGPVTANYFVLHDTADTGERTSVSRTGGVHLWVGTVSLARGADWDQAGDATKLEIPQRTCFVHVELTRATSCAITAAAADTYPNTGISTARSAGTRYTDQQYDDVANAYIVASLRRGRFLTVTAHKELDRSAVQRGHPNRLGHGDPGDFDVDRLYRLISRKLVLPVTSTFGITQQRVASRNLDGHVNAFIGYARGNAAAADQYAWPIPWQHQNPGLPQGDSTVPPYPSAHLYVMPLHNAAGQPVLHCGNGNWHHGAPP